MANKPMKKGSMSFVIREMKIKACCLKKKKLKLVQIPLTPIGMVKVKKTDNTKC